MRKFVEPVIRDVVGCAGLGAALHGLYQVSAIAVEIIGGGILVAACLFWARYRS